MEKTMKVIDTKNEDIIYDFQKKKDTKQREILASEYSVDDLDNVTELILKISYVMIQEADEKQVTDYKSFIKGIESLYDDTNWIDEVITLACTPISRQLQKIK